MYYYKVLCVEFEILSSLDAPHVLTPSLLIRLLMIILYGTMGETIAPTIEPPIR